MGIILISGCTFWRVTISPSPELEPVPPKSAEVTVITDKFEYEQGESVKVTVRNGLDRPIWYNGDLCEPMCCGVERLENSNWKPVEKIRCIQLAPPSEGFGGDLPKGYRLESYGELAQEWEAMKRLEYDAYTFIDPRTYRISFSYRLDEISPNENTLHSDEFVIKQKSYPEYGKIIDLNLMINRNGTVQEAEPVRIILGRSTFPSILSQLEGDYLLRIGERPDRYFIGTVLWSQSFPVYFDYSGPVIEGMDYSKIRYDQVFVSFKIPHDSRMKSLQLWYRPKNKIVFWKQLPGFSPIKGGVTSHNGLPAKGAMVILIQDKKTVSSTHTDENGEYTFSEVSPGEYEILVDPPAYQNVMKGYIKGLNLGDDKILSVNFSLEPCGSIAGKITDRNGKPVTEAWAQIVGFETPRYHVQMDGTYVIPYLKPGEYEVKADVKIEGDYIEISPKKVNVELDKTTTVNFVFER